jgi:hypothetical protein
MPLLRKALKRRNKISGVNFIKLFAGFMLLAALPESKLKAIC